MTQAEMRKYRSTLKDVTEEWYDYWPMSVRQVFYQMVVSGASNNDYNAYTKVSRELKNARLARTIPWRAVEDRTRSLGIAPGFGSPKEYLDDALEQFLQGYSRCLMSSQEQTVKVLIEKDALLPIVKRFCNPYCVGVTSTRGQSSISLAKEISDQVVMSDKPVVFLFLADFDPEGTTFHKSLTKQIDQVLLSIAESQVVKRPKSVDRSSYRLYRRRVIGGYLADQRYSISRVGLTMGQAHKFNLPKNFQSVKKSSVLYKSFYAKYQTDIAYEIDALRPEQLLEVLKTAFAEEIDLELQEEEIEIGKREAVKLEAFAEQVRAYVLSEWGSF